MPPKSRKKKARKTSRVAVGSPEELDEKVVFPLLRLPLELQCEILSYLHMVSLLQLARTTKDLRRFLFSRERSRSLIWRPAFKRQYPDADEFDEEWERYWKDLSEPQLASLIFEAMCQECTSEAPRKSHGFIVVHGSIPTNLCRNCTFRQFCCWEELPVDADPALKDISPMTKIPLTEQECREYQKNVDTPRNYKPTERYHIPTVVKLHRGYSRLKNPKKKEAWVDERLWSLTPSWLVLPDWVERAQDEQNLVFECLAYKVNAEIDKKLKDLGWSEESTVYFDRAEADKIDYTRYKYIEGRLETIILSLSRHGLTFNDYRAGAAPIIVTDDLWLEIQDDWIARMQKEREELTQMKKLKQLRNRISTVFVPAFSAYVLSQPPNTVVPSASEVMWMHEWRSVLCRTPWEEDITVDMAADAIEKMPTFIEQTMRDRTEYFLDLMRRSKAYAGREVTLEHLSLASTFFRCNKCTIPLNSNGYDQASFPAILVHQCSLLEPVEAGSGELQPQNYHQRKMPWDEKGGRKPTPLSTQNDEEYILLFLLSERDRSLGQERGRFWRDVADLTFDDVAYEHMNLMLDALGLDRTTTMKRMEEIQPYVEGLCQCYRDDNNPRRKGMRWLTAIHKSKHHTVDEAYPLCFAPIEDEQSLAVVRTVELKRQSRRRETFRYCFFCSSEPSLLRVLSSDRAVKESMRHLTSHGVVHPRGEKGLEEHVCATNLVPAISKIVAHGTDVELKCREEEDVGSG